ncbi:MAG: MTH1187 family thiamine-binding protein [Candidatus Ancillula sp.]|jgi:uncharacterized protein (TIGR00106 family)|nr:MTH1187 family thiamine-binding protein [Candidatus Ancillula sp.]
MNTLIALAICPLGTGDEVSKEIAKVIEIISDSGLKYQTNSMFTEIEGEWDDVMKVVKDCTFSLANQGIRTEVVLKADIRPGYNNMMTEKLDRLESAISENQLAK